MSLTGRLILVVEDEVLIADLVCDHLKDAGAEVVVAYTLKDALDKASANLSAAVIDHKLLDHTTDEVCLKLIARNIPFIVYTGFPDLDAPFNHGVIIQKPITPPTVVSTLEEMLGSTS